LALCPCLLARTNALQLNASKKDFWFDKVQRSLEKNDSVIGHWIKRRLLAIFPATRALQHTSIGSSASLRRGLLSALAGNGFALPPRPHQKVRLVIWITTLPSACAYMNGVLLRRIMQKSAFPALLAMAATYALTAIVAALLAADSLARNSIVIPQLLD
jgi:hypothetical protein